MGEQRKKPYDGHQEQKPCKLKRPRFTASLPVDSTLSITEVHVSNQIIAVHVIRLRLLFDSLFHGSITLAFYRSGHCKKLAPEYEKLGSSFNKAKSVPIGKKQIPRR